MTAKGEAMRKRKLNYMSKERFDKIFCIDKTVYKCELCKDTGLIIGFPKSQSCVCGRRVEN